MRQQKENVRSAERRLLSRTEKPIEINEANLFFLFCKCSSSDTI